MRTDTISFLALFYLAFLFYVAFGCTCAWSQKIPLESHLEGQDQAGADSLLRVDASGASITNATIANATIPTFFNLQGFPFELSGAVNDQVLMVTGTPQTIKPGYASGAGVAACSACVGATAGFVICTGIPGASDIIPFYTDSEIDDWRSQEDYYDDPGSGYSLITDTLWVYDTIFYPNDYTPTMSLRKFWDHEHWSTATNDQFTYYDNTVEHYKSLKTTPLLSRYHDALLLGGPIVGAASTYRTSDYVGEVVKISNIPGGATTSTTENAYDYGSYMIRFPPEVTNSGYPHPSQWVTLRIRGQSWVERYPGGTDRETYFWELNINAMLVSATIPAAIPKWRYSRMWLEGRAPFDKVGLGYDNTPALVILLGDIYTEWGQYCHIYIDEAIFTEYQYKQYATDWWHPWTVKFIQDYSGGIVLSDNFYGVTLPEHSDGWHTVTSSYVTENSSLFLGAGVLLDATDEIVDASMVNNQVNMFIDSGGTNLIFKVKNAAGAVKAATLALTP